MISRSGTNRYFELLEGIKLATLCHGENIHICKFLLEKGAIIPLHRHSQEQSGYLLSGRMIFTLNNTREVVREGDSWNIPSEMDHGAEAIEAAIVLEVFSPIRQAYLELAAGRKSNQQDS